MLCIGVNPISLPLDGGGLGWGCFMGRYLAALLRGSSFEKLKTLSLNSASPPLLTIFNIYYSYLLKWYL
jgi:hypothetical protein